ncbi:MAG TPA: flagellar biosynthetic protein FliO [Pseudobdellovibrionaceae bacterium]|nr:flagellar biosynthetic protein FliO [Pseudobdellovibrionaceae bacterium]
MKRLIFFACFLFASGFAFANESRSDLPAEAREVLAETSNEPAAAAVALMGESDQAVSTEEKKPEAAPLESEIPLNLDAKKHAASEGGSLFRILGGFFVLALLGGGAYYLIRRHSKPGQRQNAPQIKVLTQHWRVSGESILIGVTDHNISMLKSLSLLDDEIPVETPEKFDRVLDTEDKIAASFQAEDGEDFMMSGLSQVKESVSRRLKGMRSFQ